LLKKQQIGSEAIGGGLIFSATNRNWVTGSTPTFVQIRCKLIEFATGRSATNGDDQTTFASSMPTSQCSAQRERRIIEMR